MLEDNVKAEKAVSELKAADVNTENGITIYETYPTHSEFINLQKSNVMLFTNYIIKFEHLYHKTTN